MKNFILLSLIFISAGIYAELSPEKISEIESNVNSMGIKELQDRRAFLLEQEANILNQPNVLQAGAEGSSTASRLAGIRAELSAIQKALIAILGVGAISA